MCALLLFNKVVLPLIPTISDASIKLTGKSISHVFQTQEHLAASLQMHYSSNFIFQVQSCHWTRGDTKETDGTVLVTSHSVNAYSFARGGSPDSVCPHCSAVCSLCVCSCTRSSAAWI